MPDNALMLTISAIFMVILFAVCVSYMYAGLYTLLRPLTQKMSARSRSISIQLSAIASPIVTLISVLVFFFPSVFTLPTLYGHCHLTQCEPHVPAFFESTSSLYSIALFALTIAVIVGVLIIREQSKLARKINCLIDLMSDSSATVNDNSIEVVDSLVPMLLNVGLYKPRVIISRSVVQSLSDSEFQLIMIYELKRAKRYDNLRRLIAKLGTLMWPRFAKRLLLDDLNNAAHSLVRNDMATSGNIDMIAHQITSQVTSQVTSQITPQKVNSTLLPKYVNALFKTIALAKSNSTYLQRSNNRSVINNLGVTFFSVQYFAFMILITSAMHFLSERFL